MAGAPDWDDGYAVGDYLNDEADLPDKIRDDMEDLSVHDDEPPRPVRAPPKSRGRDPGRDRLSSQHYYEDHVQPPVSYSGPTPHSPRGDPVDSPHNNKNKFPRKEVEYDQYDDYIPRTPQHAEIPRPRPSQRSPHPPASYPPHQITSREEYRASPTHPPYHKSPPPTSQHYHDDPPDRKNYSPTLHHGHHLDPDYGYYDSPTRRPHPESHHGQPYGHDLPHRYPNYGHPQSPMHDDGRRQPPPSRRAREQISSGELRSRIIEVEVSVLRESMHSGDKKAHNHYLDNQISRQVQEMFQDLNLHYSMDKILKSPELEALRMMHAGLDPMIIQHTINKQFGHLGTNLWAGVERVLREENPRDYSEYLGRYLYRRHWEKKHPGVGAPRARGTKSDSPARGQRRTPKGKKRAPVDPYQTTDGTIDFSISATGGSGKDLKVPAADISQGNQALMNAEVAFKKTKNMDSDMNIPFWQMHCVQPNAPYYLHDASLKFLRTKRLAKGRVWIHGRITGINRITCKIGNRYNKPPNSVAYVVSLSFPTRPHQGGGQGMGAQNLAADLM